MNTLGERWSAVEALRALVAGVPVVKRAMVLARVRKSDPRALSGLRVFLTDGSRQLWLADVRGDSLKPQAAKLAAFDLKQYVTNGLGDYAVVVAPYVSPRAAEVLLSGGVGYFDLSGNCRLASGPLFIERSGFPNAHTRRTELRSLFSPGAERVLRALLDPELQRRTWTIREVADRAFPGVSLGQAHKVAKLLEAQAYLERKTGGLVVNDADKLLREWREHYRFQRNRATRYYSPLSASKLRERFSDVANHDAESGVGGVMASFSAAEALAPHVRQHRFFAYWLGDRGPLVTVLELKEVGSGENVVVYEPYDEGVFYPPPQGAGPVTSPVQTYLDLVASPARGEEAAQAVFERLLKKAYAR